MRQGFLLAISSATLLQDNDHCENFIILANSACVRDPHFINSRRLQLFRYNLFYSVTKFIRKNYVKLIRKSNETNIFFSFLFFTFLYKVSDRH